MPKLIVGCGYLGSRVARLWHAAGERVHATTRGRADHLRGLGIEPIVCDVLDADSLRTGLGGIPEKELTVVYCVALDRTSGRSMRDVYVDGLSRFLEVCPPADRFIYVSSSSVYGQVDGEQVDETWATEPREESGRVVLEAETVLAQLRPEAVVLRFAGIYGPGRLMRRQAIETGAPIVGDANRWLNLIHVEDGSRAVLAAADLAQPGAVYNVSDGSPTSRRDFYNCLATLLKAPPPRFEPVPPGAPTPPHESTHRRIVNLRLREQLALVLGFPSYREGLPASI